MRSSDAIGFLPTPESISSTESLTAIRGGVDLEGSNAYFDVQFTNQRGFRAQVPFASMPAVLSEIRAASAVLLQRQRLQLDGGAAALLALCETALRPAHIEVLQDPTSLDRLVIHQFYDHAPIAFRVSPLELMANMATVSHRMRALAH
jgi:hypothetical protein